MAPRISESTAASIRSKIDSATSNSDHIPGVVFCSVDKLGQPLFNHASGTLGVDNKTPMSMQTIFWIASCTKLIGAIAAMQIVEQGKIGLDDAEAVEKICPELKAKKILTGFDEDGHPILVDKQRGITMRMLLSHTAGFGYSFFNHNIRKWGGPEGIDELSGFTRDVLTLPLVHEPGTRWEYGVNIDWAGTIVSRIEKTTLEVYFQKHIFHPLGIKNISLIPNKGMKQSLAHMHQKEMDGKIRGRDHLFRLPLICDVGIYPNLYQSAGAGGFGSPIEYCQILATLLNDGTSPTTGARILKPETVEEMFRNQIPEIPNIGRQGIPAAKPDYTNPLPDLLPQGEAPQGWALSGMINLEPYATGRSAGSMSWAGLANLFWWCDRKKGIAGMIATQILPFGNLDVVTLFHHIETEIYKGLE